MSHKTINIVWPDHKALSSFTVFVVADVHVGNHRLFGGQTVGGLNERCRDTINVLRDARQLASRDPSEHGLFIVAGDLFDTDSPSPAMIAATADALSANDNHETVVIMGNHDMSSTEKFHNAVAPLNGRIRVVDTETVVYDLLRPGSKCPVYRVVCVPFMTGPGKVWLEEVLKELKPVGSAPVLLVMHLGLETDKTPPYLRGCDDSIHVKDLYELCLKYGVTDVASGNWHMRQYLQCTDPPLSAARCRAWQVGALVPTGFDNPSDPFSPTLRPSTRYGTCLKFVGTGRTEVEVLNCPQFFKIDAERLFSDNHSSIAGLKGLAGLAKVYINLATSHETATCYAYEIADLSRATAGYKLTYTDSLVDNKAAVESVCSSDNLKESLSSYVDSCVRDDLRSEVLAKCTKLLNL